MITLESLLSRAPILEHKTPVDVPISGITDDSRMVTKGDVFFAVSGKQLEGGQFIQSAIAAGAGAVIVDRSSDFESHPRTVRVASVRASLAHAACAWNKDPSQHLRVVGITGTNGKTTSSFLLKSIWDHEGIPSAMLGTIEYRFGTHSRDAPLTTPGALELQSHFKEMVQLGLSHAVMEVSSISLDQSRTLGTRFSTALFTNLTQDHLDYHGSVEAYFNAKRRLFEEYSLATAIVNTDDEWGRQLIQRLPSGVRIISFGMESGASVCADNANFSLQGTQAAIQIIGQEYSLQSPLIGRHNLMNCLGVLACCESLGHPIEKALIALKAATGAPGRLERVDSGLGSPHVFVDYAHTPDALENVLQSLNRLRTQLAGFGRIITVFGCGGDRDKSKRPLMGRAASQLSDVAIATSDNPRTEDPESIIDAIELGIVSGRAKYFRDSKRAGAIELALSMASPSDIILVAGKGHETYQIIGREKLPFDDRQVIRDYYAK